MQSPASRLFAQPSVQEPKNTSKLRVTALCEGNPPVTGGFPSQMASSAENVLIWWRRNNIERTLHVFLWWFLGYAYPARA